MPYYSGYRSRNNNRNSTVRCYDCQAYVTSLSAHRSSCPSRRGGHGHSAQHAGFGGDGSVLSSYKPGDWTCPTCLTHQFASRDTCRTCDTPKPASAASVLLHNCSWCQKKFVTDAKLEQHVYSDHPFAAHDTNTHRLTTVELQYLLMQLRDYVRLADFAATAGWTPADVAAGIQAYLAWDGDASGVLPGEDAVALNPLVEFVWASHMLLPVAYARWRESSGKSRGYTRPDDIGSYGAVIQDVAMVDDDVAADDAACKTDLLRITTNHLEFCERAKSSLLLAKAVSDAGQLRRMIEDFQLFLNLGRTRKRDNFCPSMIIDLVWHASMMNSGRYTEMCVRFVGKPLDHCLQENEDHHADRYAAFVRMFQHRHAPQSPMKIEHLVLGAEGRAIEALEEQLRVHLEKQRLDKAERDRQYQERQEQNSREREAFFRRNGYYPRAAGDDGQC